MKLCTRVTGFRPAGPGPDTQVKRSGYFDMEHFKILDISLVDDHHQYGQWDDGTWHIEGHITSLDGHPVTEEQ